MYRKYRAAYLTGSAWKQVRLRLGEHWILRVTVRFAFTMPFFVADCGFFAEAVPSTNQIGPSSSDPFVVMMETINFRKGHNIPLFHRN